MGVEPTKLTARILGWSSSASTATLSPCNTLNTPSGSPAFFNNSARATASDGSFSEGLQTKVLPQASATGNIHIGTMAGKLNGVMPATTPKGWRSATESTPRPTLSLYSPLSSCGMPQANSTTSNPRAILPFASDRILPCSAVMIAASVSVAASTRARKRNSTRARTCGGVADQAGKASAAAAIAASASSREASATRPITAPVAGLNTSAKRPEVPATCMPFTKCAMSRTVLLMPGLRRAIRPRIAALSLHGWVRADCCPASRRRAPVSPSSRSGRSSAPHRCHRPWAAALRDPR